MKCQKCHKQLNDCQACKGGTMRSPLGGKLTCSKCNTTGSVCSTHGGYWK